jgi:hypothetical protein
MTCKDCVHYAVCKFVEPYHLDVKCNHFKNKADFVEVSKVAEILDEAFGNDYPCNFNNIDEWLPYLCEYANTCDCSSVKCWEQLIKHYDERGADNG